MRALARTPWFRRHDRRCALTCAALFPCPAATAQLIIYAYRLTRLPRVTPFRRDTLTMKDGGEARTRTHAFLTI